MAGGDDGLHTGEENPLGSHQEFVSAADSSRPLVFELREADVLLGRGKRNNFRSANMQLRDMAEERADLYIQAHGKQEKARVAQRMIADIESCGARFLKAVSVPDRINGTYKAAFQVVQPAFVSIKVKQLLRDRSAIQVRERVGLPKSKRRMDALKAKAKAKCTAPKKKAPPRLSDYQDILVEESLKAATETGVFAEVSPPLLPPPPSLPLLPDELFPYPPRLNKLCITHRLLEQVAYRRHLEKLRSMYDMQEFDLFLERYLDPKYTLAASLSERHHVDLPEVEDEDEVWRAYYGSDTTEDDDDSDAITESEADEEPTLPVFYQGLPAQPPECMRKEGALSTQITSKDT